MTYQIERERALGQWEPLEAPQPDLAKARQAVAEMERVQGWKLRLVPVPSIKKGPGRKPAKVVKVK